MRISDWSSDVCSSDLGRVEQKRGLGDRQRARVPGQRLARVHLAAAQHVQEAAAGAGVERLGAAQRAGVEQLHPGLEAAQYAFEAIQGHVLSDLHGNVAESYPIDRKSTRLNSSH